MTNETIDYREIRKRAITPPGLGHDQLAALVDDAQQQGPWALIQVASKLRYARFGSAVRLCSIVPGKLGGCSEDCKWCAQSAPGLGKPAQHTRTDEIIQAARDAKQLRAGYIGIVNSGRQPSRNDLEKVMQAAAGISESGDVCKSGNSGNIREEDKAGAPRVCASLGSLTPEQANALAGSSVVRYHHNLETSRRFFPQVVTSHTYDEKLATLQAAKNAGLSLCCGGLFGLGETWDDRIELALTIRDEVKPAVVPLNFLVPIEGTELGSRVPITPLECLTVIAMFRLAMPNVDLKVAGGRESNLRDLQSWIFHAGATSIMVGNYLTTAGRSPKQDQQMLNDLNLQVVNELPEKSFDSL